jgi:hypothetical protein
MKTPSHSRRWWRWLQAVAGVAVIGFVVRHLVRNWEAIKAEPVDWTLSPAWIVLSLVLVLVTYALLAESWRRMLAGWGPLLRYLDAARIWVLSSMGKYLPGKIWAIAGMALLAERRGVSAAAATGSAILLQVVSIGTGALLVGITGMTALEAHWPGGRLAVGLVLLASVVGLVAILWPPLAARLLARFQRGSDQRISPSPRAVGFGIIANLLAWAGYGVALWLLARGVLPNADLGIADAIGAFAGSYIAGLLFLLAPGGLGVREGVFVWMLQDRIGPANALVLAGVSRIGMTVADLLAALPFVLLYRSSPRD